VNNPEFRHSPEQSIIEQKVRSAVGVNALRKIGVIVAREQQADTEKPMCRAGLPAMAG